MRFRFFSTLVLLFFVQGVAFAVNPNGASLDGASPDGEVLLNDTCVADADAVNLPVCEDDEEWTHVLVRLLPDIRQLITQPGVPLTTSIDIGSTYRDSPKFSGVSPIFELARRGSTSTVEPTLEDGVLTLEWKQIGSSQITIQVRNPETRTIYNETIRLEAWGPDFFTIFFTFLGGLGVFLVGMRLMSEGLQMVAGARLRRMIATLADNRFSATAVGLGVTAVIQSSTVTTVTVVGFVNSQIMTLPQAIGVIMGANIGTTLTAWVMSLNIGRYGLVILGIAVFFYLFSKNEKLRLIGMACVGLGFLFFGLELMQQGFRPLRDLPAFAAWMEVFSTDTYWGILGCIAVGCILTVIVQSSTATIGITIALAIVGVIPFETAAALVLGENLGTTITAVLASIGTSPNAKRAAYFHVFYNFTAVVYLSILFWPFISLVTWAIGVDPETGVILNVAAGIALTHTLFSVFNTIVFLPFTRIIAKFLIWLVPDTAESQGKPRLTTLGKRIVEAPSMSIERSRGEVIRMGNICGELSRRVLDIMQSETPDQQQVDASHHDEGVLDALQDEIIEFISSMLSGNITSDVAWSARQQLRMADNLESISDYLITILKSDLKLRQSGLSFPEEEKLGIIAAHESVNEMIEKVVRYYFGRKSDRKSGNIFLEDVRSQCREINRRAKDIRNKFMQRLSEERHDPQIVIALNTQINAYRRVREHIRNVARAIVGVR